MKGRLDIMSGCILPDEHITGMVTVAIREADTEHIIRTEEGIGLLYLMQENGINYVTPCGGMGRCGKCGIRLLKGELDITPEDENVYSEDELRSGMRLACRSIVRSDIEIELLQHTDKEMQAVGSINTGIIMHRNNVSFTGRRYAVAVDIGTTTLALSLVDRERLVITDTYTAINPQQRFGADVITRIGAASRGSADEMHRCVCAAILDGIELLIRKNEAECEYIECISITGNTTMLHILLGYPVDGLGIYPFKPVSLAMEKKICCEVFRELHLREIGPGMSNIPVVIFPGCSAFVGADIVSGIYSLGLNDKKDISVLIDLGTNGEMAIGSKDKLMVTSTAAGPAFEGGNISCGMGSVGGAVCTVNIEEGNYAKGNEHNYAGYTYYLPDGNIVRCRTINNELPEGICGTGVIDMTAEILKAHIADDTGAIDEKYAENGFTFADGKNGAVVFSQKDIREVQLAKSAIRAGLEILIRRCGIEYEDIDKLYIAGGFGYYMNVENAAAIGMIPEELKDKAVAVGNSALNGAVRYLVDEGAEEKLNNIASMAEEITLASDEEFNRLYMEHMMFNS